MSDVAFYLLVFLVIGSVFLFIHLLIGSFIRPAKPEADKLTIYECGEPTVGSAWIQFDLRYYVVALLFVVFDVEVAFFFPWAVVFGTTNEYAAEQAAFVQSKSAADEARATVLLNELQSDVTGPALGGSTTLTAAGAKNWAWIALLDVLVFFAVLMVGFAYLWRRGDIDWVRVVPESPPGKPADIPGRV